MNDGWIIREVNPKDRRQHLLSLTDKAKPWIKKIEENLQLTNAHFLSFLPENQRAPFVDMLQLLINSTKELPIEEIELYYNRANEKQDK
jgi:DNA-binding MarR family transcriptional regulator